MDGWTDGCVGAWILLCLYGEHFSQWVGNACHHAAPEPLKEGSICPVSHELCPLCILGVEDHDIVPDSSLGCTLRWNCVQKPAHAGKWAGRDLPILERGTVSRKDRAMVDPSLIRHWNLKNAFRVQLFIVIVKVIIGIILQFIAQLAIALSLIPACTLHRTSVTIQNVLKLFD